jgi:hypothetical protein
MTTQPSDWAVAQAWRELTASKMSSEGLEEVVGVGVAYLEKRARELDASGGEYRTHDRIEFALRDAGFDPATAAAMTAACERVLATPRAAEAGDGDLLDWLCTGERKMIQDTIDSGWFRVYQDVADADAEHAEWRALTDDFYPTHREAIRAAMGAVGAGGSAPTKDGGDTPMPS